MIRSPQSNDFNITQMSLPPVTLSSDSIEDLNLNAVANPTADVVEKSDYPLSDALDGATSPLSGTFRRSNSPSSDVAEPLARKEWPLLSFEQHVQHWLRGKDAVDSVGNEYKIEEMYQDYNNDYELVKPILDTLIRFTVDNHEMAHEMAHGILHNLSLGHTLLIPNPAWIKRKAEQTIAAAAAEVEERKKVEGEEEARSKSPNDLLTKVQAFTTKAKANANANAKSKVEDKFDTASIPAADSAEMVNNKTGPTDKKDKNQANDLTNNKAADKPGDSYMDSKPKGKKKFVPYIPKYLLDVQSRKYCMNDVLVTRGSIGDVSIVSCLAASARKAHARIVAHKSKAESGILTVSLPDRRGGQGLLDGQPRGQEKGGDASTVAVTAEAVVGDLKAIEASYPERIDGLIAEVVEAMMWM